MGPVTGHEEEATRTQGPITEASLPETGHKEEAARTLGPRTKSLPATGHEGET